MFKLFVISFAEHAMTCDYSPVHTDHVNIGKHVYEAAQCVYFVPALMKAWMAETHRQVSTDITGK